MESKIKVSIIVPAYNVENYIEDCLNSLVNQTLKDIEIIVVNDESTDSTFDIIKKYANNDSRIKVINQKNQGVAGARNSGLEIALGEFIGFVDSDDWIDSNYFELLYNSAKENDADMAIASILKHKKKYLKYNAKYTKLEVANTIQEKIKLCQDKKKRFFYVWNKLCKADVIKNNSINFPQGRVFEDVKFSTEAVFYSKKIIAVPNTYYHYIERQGSIVKSKKSEKKRNDHILAYKELQEFAKIKGFKLPEELNYYTKYRKFGVLKIYQGLYKKKILLFDFLPIYLHSAK